MKKSWQPPVVLLLVSGLFWLLLDANDVRTAVIEGLVLCAESVIPALFPFLTVSSLLLSLGFGDFLAKRLSGLMRLYRIPGSGSAALLLGLLGGYPVGARTVVQLVESRQLSPEEGGRLLSFCNNSNPAFLINVLGAGVFHSFRAGCWLWGIHVFSALLSGLLCCRIFHKPYPLQEHPRRNRPYALFVSVHFSTALVQAVETALTAMLSVCAFVTFFYVLALPLRQIPGVTGTLLTGFLELFSATPRLSPTAAGWVLAAGLSGWGGCSVHCQTLAILSGSGLSMRSYLLGKGLQALLSAVFAGLLCQAAVF